MPFNPEQTQQETLAWYVHLALQPGWMEYARHQVKRYAKWHPALFEELPAQLEAVLQEKFSSGQRGNGG